MVLTDRLNRDFYKTMISIAIPIAFQNLIFSSLNMVDTVMIGKLGKTNIAAVALANQIFFIYSLILFGINSGSSIFTAQFWGKKDVKNIRKILGLSLILGVGASLLFFIAGISIPNFLIRLFTEDKEVINLGVSYLVIIVFSYPITAITFSYGAASRSIGQTKLPMVASCISLGCNTLFNYLLIFGKFGFPELGIRGAAYATLTARIIEVFIILGSIYYKKGVLSAKLKEMLDLSKDFIIKYFNTTTSVILNELFWSVGMSMYCAAYGRISTDAVAAVQISNIVRNLFVVLSIGVANACAIMIGNKIGANKYKEADIYSKKFTYISLLLGLTLGLLLVLGSKYVIIFFDVSADVKLAAVKILIVYAIFLPATNYTSVLIVGILRSGGDTKFSFLLETLCVWLIGVPLAFIGALLFDLPVYLVVALVNIEEIVKMIVGLYRVKSNKWIKNIVDEI
ncbi:MATE family efflux transporter [Abyssisolibacter fermentans]|uniref:MATE family efflux transporter n=1 Tax=Abyssisolibacter fermentans TaxID=1766203 RepID=UPI00082C6621|nr:MATE family efflux transporter [Abyssisolibacter fermentans]